MRICDDCKREVYAGENRKTCGSCGKACCSECIKKHNTDLATPRLRQRDRPHLTRGEKLVWAAVFAKYYNISDPPLDITADPNKWGEWENSQTHAAIECAATAVNRLRTAQASIIEGFGIDDEVSTFLDQMLRAG